MTQPPTAMTVDSTSSDPNNRVGATIMSTVPYDLIMTFYTHCVMGKRVCRLEMAIVEKFAGITRRKAVRG